MTKSYAAMFVAFLACFLLLSNISLGFQDFLEMKIEPAEIITDLNEKAIFHLTLTNNQDEDDDFIIMTEGPFIGWVTQSYFLVPINATETKTVDIVLYPTETRGKYKFTTTVKSKTRENIFASASYHINVPPPYYLNNFESAVIGNELNLGFEMNSLRPMQYVFSFIVFDSKDEVLTKFQKKKTIKGTENFSFTYLLSEDILAGEYRVAYIIEDTPINGSGNFFIPPVHSVIKQVKRERDFMRETITLILTNEGNTVEDKYSFEQEFVPTDFTGMVTVPAGCTEKFDKKVCVYSLDNLAPGETREVKFTIEFWPSYLQIGVAAIFILLVLFFSFFKMTSPTINKKASKKTPLKHSISIELKNPFFHNLKNAVVRDWVSPLAEVVVHEIESVKPVIRKSSAGTELIWRLGNINPKETRILTYNIKTRIEGSLKMPKAFARFRTPKGKKFRIYSKPVTLR